MLPAQNPSYMPCQNCGHEVKFGEWPFCPHERVSEYHPFIPYWDQHVATEPVYIESVAQRKRLMKQNNMDYAPRRMGEPGCEV